jgi:hypothetical protein
MGIRVIKTRKELERVLESFPYERILFNSHSVWNKLEALYLLELMGFAFSKKLLCELLREWGEAACRE